MYDPRFRLALLICLILMVFTITRVIYHLLFQTGLTLTEYFNGVVSVSSAALGGFIFVWICIKFINAERFKKTGFEASKTDDTGTSFNFSVSLSKFIPEIIAPPSPSSTRHPLESELLGFLNGFRHWPYDISGNTNETLFERATKQWQAMNTLEGCTPYHRIAALAQDLSLIYAYAEKRKVHPFYQFWKMDDVSYSRRCDEHGGLSAFILTTFPSFKKLHHDEDKNKSLRRALTTAVKYRDNPNSIPNNCDPLARDIYESLHRAHQISLKSAQNNEGAFTPTEEQTSLLRINAAAYFQTVIEDLDVNPADITEDSAGIYLGNGIIIIRMCAIIKKYATTLNPTIRSDFRLWSLDNRPHASWPYFLDVFASQLGLLKTEFNNTKSTDGLFQLTVDDLAFDNCVVLNLPVSQYPSLRQSLDSLPAYKGIIDIKQDTESYLEHIKDKSHKVDLMIQDINSTPPTHTLG
ncbi:MAG: hypothetical protein OSB62_05605 [Alphaproteobacteria bacterium]|nr:hypothetical protein [Alphaproteobacteria bacterium]